MKGIFTIHVSLEKIKAKKVIYLGKLIYTIYNYFLAIILLVNCTADETTTVNYQKSKAGRMTGHHFKRPFIYFSLIRYV